jgi:hypothetical protein
MRKFVIVRLILVGLLMDTVCLTACDPRGLPGFKQEAKRQEERITRETEEAIKKSTTLQELHHLCTEQIPRPEGFVLVNKFRGLHGEIFLGYGYHSPLDYQSVRRFYTNYFNQHGWQLTKQKDGGWGPSKIEFRKEGHEVMISESGSQDEGINYFLECVKLSDSAQQAP